MTPSDFGPADPAAASDGARTVLRGLFGGFAPLDYGTFGSLRPGVDILPLYGLSANGSPWDPELPSAAILRYEPGAHVPRHLHTGFEHIFVLEGSQRDAHGIYTPGTCVISPPGTRHAVTSDRGCLVLAIWHKFVEVLDEHA